MSKNVNTWSSVRELGIDKSEAFRLELSHFLSMVITARVEKALDDHAIYDKSKRDLFVRRYCQAVRDTLDKKLDWIFQKVANQVLPNIIGDVQGDMTDVVLSLCEAEILKQLESGWLLTWVLQWRDELLQSLKILRPLWRKAYDFFKPKTHTVDAVMNKGANYISPFSNFLSDELISVLWATTIVEDLLNKWHPLVESTDSLERDKRDLINLIYNRVLFEWFSGKNLEHRFKHSLHLIDEPSLKRWVKWETREWIYFLPIDIFLTYGVVSFLSRWVFDFSSEEDIENAAQELDEVEDLENFASVLKDQILGQVLPYISQISVKAPFLDWIKSKINSEEIKRILLLIKNHKKDRNKVTMNNIYWLLWVDKEMQVKKAYFIDFL